MCVAISKVASGAGLAGNLCEPEVGYMSSKHATVSLLYSHTTSLPILGSIRL